MKDILQEYSFILGLYIASVDSNERHTNEQKAELKSFAHDSAKKVYKITIGKELNADDLKDIFGI